MLMIYSFSSVHDPCFFVKTPHLVNLNEDPLMSECLLYYIKDGITRWVRLFLSMTLCQVWFGPSLVELTGVLDYLAS